MYVRFTVRCSRSQHFRGNQKSILSSITSGGSPPIGCFMPVSIAALAVPGALAASLRESLPGVPTGWSVSGTPSDSDAITLSIALKQQNIDQLESLLASVSEPSSPNYGKYYTADQVNALFGPQTASVDAVQNWASKSGLTSGVGLSQAISIKTTVGNANAIFGADFEYYKDESTGMSSISCFVSSSIRFL